MANRGRVLSQYSRMVVSSTRLVKWSSFVCTGCLLLLQHQYQVEGSRTRLAEEPKGETSPTHPLSKRLDSPPSLTNTDGPISTEQEESDGQRFLSALGSYWYVLLVILVILVVAGVFLCACIVRRRRRHHHSLRMEMGTHHYSRSPDSNHSTRQLSSTDTHSAPPHTNSSVLDLASSPGSLSIDPTPIPSPQPSFASSSQRSHRSSGHKRRRNLSPGHTSSGSEETIKAYETRSVSSLGLGAAPPPPHYHPRIPRAESVNGGERRRSSRGHHRGHRRSTSNPQVKVTPLLDNTSLYSSPSVISMMSASSNRSNRSNRSSRSTRSGRSNRSHSESSSTVVEVDVKVHLSKEEEREARSEIAAALAESARQLAQSAANFGQEEEPLWHSQSLPYHHAPSPHRLTLSTTHSLPTTMSSKRQLFPSHSSSAITSSREFYASRPTLPRAVPTASLDRPRNTASLDRPGFFERSHRDSIGKRSQPESPLTFSISSPSQKSLASNNEYAPGNNGGNYYPPVSHPVHFSRSPHYLKTYHSSSAVTGEQGLEMGQSPSQVSLDYIHSPTQPLPSLSLDHFQNQNGSYPLPHEPLSGVSLDFNHHKSKLPLHINGMSSPSGAAAAYPSNLPSRLEELRSRLDSDLRMELKTGAESDSNSSTLRASSHSDNKDRLSRLSEKSEQMESENEDWEAMRVENGGEGGDLTVSGSGGGQDEMEAGNGGENGGHSSLASGVEVPHHIHQHNSLSKPFASLYEPPSPYESTELAVNGTNHEEGLVESTHSSQSTNNHSSTLTRTLTRQRSLPDVSDRHHHHQEGASQDSVSNSLHRSSSGPSIDEDDDEEEPVSSIASGYAATGSASSLDTSTRESNGSATAKTAAASKLNQALESQYSYPLQRLLGESLSCDIDDEESFASLQQSLVVGQNHRRNEQYHHRNHRHGDKATRHHRKQAGAEHLKATREMPSTSYRNGITQNYHGNGHERVRYNHSSHHESITIDV